MVFANLLQSLVVMQEQPPDAWAATGGGILEAGGLVRMRTVRTLSIAVLTVVSGVFANDVTYLNGRVRLQDGAAPGHVVEIKLSCPGADPIRQTTTNKKGGFFLKVERDEFNHVARALPSFSMDIQDGSMAGSCRLVAVLPGYQSSEINLATFTIGKDLKLPELVLTPRSR
jgi:hypothetical protein